MQITINGEAKIIPDGSTVAMLVELLSIDTRKVAIEANLAIIPRSLYDKTALNNGDIIEIVQFIGGG